MIRAFAYLILHSARNRLVAQLARLRNPRYAIALALGLFYVWGVYLRPTAHRDMSDANRVLGSGIAPFVPLFLLFIVAWTWIVGGDRSALAFTEAEVTMLFSAPVTRRTLVLYRIAKIQLPVLMTSLVWTLVFTRRPGQPLQLTHVLAFWVVLTGLFLNRLGVALTRAASGESMRGFRRSAPAITVFTAIVLMVAIPLMRVKDQLRGAGGFGEAKQLVAGALQAAPARWALAPFTLLIAPMRADGLVDWASAMLPALAIVALLLGWVLYTESAFEEAAAEAAVAQAKRIEEIRSRRTGGTVAKVSRPDRTLPLAPTGAPAVALVWKNLMWLIRTGQLRGLIAPPLVALGALLLFGSRSPIVAVLVAVACAAIFVVMMMTGPMAMRNDLRNELLHLSVLKTYPLRGRDIVIAEVASSSLPVAGMQTMLALVGLYAVSFLASPPIPASVRLALMMSAPAIAVALSVMAFMIHNGIALLFPGWVKLGGSGPTGIETIGLGMMSLVIVAFSMALLLIAPGIAGTITFALLRDRLVLAIVAGALVASVLLLAESVACTVVLGRALDRVEPMHLG